MNKILFLSLVLTFSFFACDSEDSGKGSVEIILLAKYQQEPLVMFEEYGYFDGGKIAINRSEFYLSNIILKGSSVDQKLNDVLFVDFTEQNKDLASAKKGISFIFNDIDAGNYSGIEIGTGVAPEYNKSTPADFPPTHPLGRADSYWAGWDSYIFSKTEGYYRTKLKTDFGYHTGASPFLTNYNVNTIQHPIRVKSDQTTKIYLDVDHAAIFGNATNFVDIEANNIIHEPEDSKGFIERLSKAITME